MKSWLNWWRGRAGLKPARAVKELRNKAMAIANPYVPKGSIDELFNFVDAIDESKSLLVNKSQR